MATKYDQLKLDNQLCFPLYACAKEVVRRYKPLLDEIDLTYTQYITMMVMWDVEEISVKALGEYLYLDSGTLTPVLKTLEAKGFVSRARSLEDERNLIVTITDRGRNLQEQAKDIPYKLGACLQIEQDDALELHRILRKFMEQM